MSLLDLVFPKTCVGCGKWGSYFCLNCRDTIRLLPYLKCPICDKPSFGGLTHKRCRSRYEIDGLISFFRYEGIIRKAVKQIKYRLITDLIHEFFDCIPSSSWRSFSLVKNPIFDVHTSCIVPVPLHLSRFNSRGFNQAEVIGKELSKRIHVPVETRVLTRVKKTTPQVKMKNREDRLGNMKNVFMLHDSSILSRVSSVLLVDDVFTTGATIRSAATVLKEGGVKYVWGVTLAQ